MVAICYHINMEKYKPHYDLEVIKSLINQGLLVLLD